MYINSCILPFYITSLFFLNSHLFGSRVYSFNPYISLSASPIHLFSSFSCCSLSFSPLLCALSLNVLTILQISCTGSPRSNCVNPIVKSMSLSSPFHSSSIFQSFSLQRSLSSPQSIICSKVFSAAEHTLHI